MTSPSTTDGPAGLHHGAAPAGTARAGVAMAVAAMSCVQLGLALSVGLLDQLGAAGTAWLRLGCAGVIFLVLVRPRPADLSRSGWLTCIALGVFTAGLTTGFLLAMQRLPLGIAVALEFLGPLSVAVARGRGVTRLAAVPAGLGVLCLTEPWHGSVDALGVCFALAAAGCWAAYILLTQRAGDEVAGMAALAVSMPVAALVTLPFGLPAVVAGFSPQVLAAGFGLAVLLPVIPFSLELSALRRLTTAAFGTLMCLEPAIAVVVGLVILDQLPGALAVVGIGLVIAAGIAAERGGARS